LIASKGSVIIELENNNNQLFFIGSHLPMDNDKEDLGLDDRIKAMNQVIKYLRNNLDVKRKFHILWTGDLNFRIDNEGHEQLLNQLEIGVDHEPNPLLFQDLSKIFNYNPTCKTVMYNDKDTCDPDINPNDFPDINPEDNNTCYEIKSIKVKKNFLGMKKEKIKIRIPSYCDRVIGYSNKGIYPSDKFDTRTFYPMNGEYEFTKYSDHNPILTTLEVTLDNNEKFNISYNPKFKGGRINFNYSNKYIKYLNKYQYSI
jgi:hypothetical protein